MGIDELRRLDTAINESYNERVTIHLLNAVLELPFSMFCLVAAKRVTICLVLASLLSARAQATPANKAAFEKYFGAFLPAKLDSCTTCHLPKAYTHMPTGLSEFPHNSFGHRLALAADELRKAGKRPDIPARLKLIAAEDADHDGVDNLTELLLGTAPGDAADRPTTSDLKRAAAIKKRFTAFLSQYRWQPFDPVVRTPVPLPPTPLGITNPIDAFINKERTARGLTPRPQAGKDVLLRRIYLDLIGLSPTPAEIAAFEQDSRPDAYERVVDTLLASPRYGERWGRHWMDVWRYSDWAGWADGNQIRDSKPFVWRWRDWIVDSLNADRGYDAMVQEMLAGDEIAPDNPNALRATGYLVRNYKLLSREQWMDDLLNHTGRAFLGLTLGCAKCHNHMYDPIKQEEYYRVRAIFEPHNVRTDRVPGQPDVTADGLVHAFDADPKATTYLYVRGDERNPDKSRALTPGVPESLGGTLNIVPIALPLTASNPDRREFVVKETIAAADAAVEVARKELTSAAPSETEIKSKALASAVAAQCALLAVLEVEKIEETAGKTSPLWTAAAQNAVSRQRQAAWRLAELNAARAQAALKSAKLSVKPEVAANPKSKQAVEIGALQAKAVEADKAVAAAEAAVKSVLTTAYVPRTQMTYPTESTGRRAAFAKWLTGDTNPLTARIAVNQIWMRHFGTGIVPSVDDFGRNGRAPSNPQLLDWLAAELMSDNWRMKPIHRLIVTSRAYKMSSTPDPVDEKRDPDNTYLWRMPSRRMEAEVVRDNMLYVSGALDETRGGPEVDHMQGLVSRRRSIYLRTAAEKQVEFLSIFDGPSVTECYARKPSVMPQQALALANSELAIRQAQALAETLSKQHVSDTQFIDAAFLQVLARRPTSAEQKLCSDFLLKPAGTRTSAVQTTNPATSPTATTPPRRRANLVLVLFNHNDFVTIR